MLPHGPHVHIVGGLRNGTGLVGVADLVWSGAYNICLPRSTAAPMAASLTGVGRGVEVLRLRELLPRESPTKPEGSWVSSVQSSAVLS